MRTRNLPKMLNCEVESYLEENDIIIVPVGTVEMHGGLPLDAETVASEGIAIKLAEKVNALILSGLQYFYAGATASGRGTIQVSVRQGIDYLMAIAKDLLRQGFKRQIYLSLHGPALLTCGPVVRDFFDKTGIPILYIDILQTLFQNSDSLIKAGNLTNSPHVSNDLLDAIIIGSYDLLGRLEEVPITSQFATYNIKSTTSQFSVLANKSVASTGFGYYAGAQTDHMPTVALQNANHRQEIANKGKKIIEKMVEILDIPTIVQKMQDLKFFNDTVAKKFPWVPSVNY